MNKLITCSTLFFSLILSSCSNKKFNNDNWAGEPNSGFRKLQTISAKKYLAATGSEQSSKAAAEIIEKGGNAIDAAIAAQLVLNVVEPHSSGIGGGGFILYYDNKTKKIIYFDGRETAPALVEKNMFLDIVGNPREFKDAVVGGLSVGTPGLLKALKKSHQSLGKLPWKTLFEPAIKAANEGFEVSERFALLSKEIEYLKLFDETAEIYLDKNGNARKVGDIIKNPRLAKTLKEISESGIEIFYNGQIGKDLANAVKNSKTNPGYLRFSDLQNYEIKTGQPLCGKYRKYKICTMQIPSGGSTVLQILGILENFDLQKYKNPISKEVVHLTIEATRLAYKDRNKYVGDIKNIPLSKMLSKNYLQERASLISLDKKIENVESGKFGDLNLAFNENQMEPPSTTHLSIVDKEGNSVTMTTSIEYFFGSAISVHGFLLNNQMTDFSFISEKNGKKIANAIAPNKRPRSSMSPTFVFDENNNLIMTLGSPGGPRIIQSVVKTIINHLDFGLDIQESISAPSFIVLNDIVELEEGKKITKLQKPLENLGHKVKILPIVSGINAVTIEKNELKGGTDPRREGFVFGL
jgi:gamma-glutamyltranspeptidase/glutathione hydrolase